MIVVITYLIMLRSRCVFGKSMEDFCCTCSEAVPEGRSPWHKGEGKVLKSGEKAIPALFNTSLGIKQSLTPRSMSPDPKEAMRDQKSELSVTCSPVPCFVVVLT